MKTGSCFNVNAMPPPGAFAESVKSWLNAGLGFLYPELCQLCGQARATPAEGFICAGCRSTVRFIEQPFCERCGLPYQGAITTRFPPATAARASTTAPIMAIGLKLRSASPLAWSDSGRNRRAVAPFATPSSAMGR